MRALLGLVFLCGSLGSTTLAATWSSYGPAGAGINVVIGVSASNADIAYAVVRSGIYKTTDGGAQWSSLSSAPNPVVPTAILVDPSDDSRVWVGSFGGFLMTTDGGTSWSFPPLPFYVGTIVRHPTIATRLFVTVNSGSGGIYRSDDGGNTWALQGLSGQQAQALAIDPVTPSTMYAAVLNGGIQKSVDSGASWSPMGPTGSGWAVVVDPVTPTTVYAAVSSGSGNAVYKSVNGGLTWSNAGTGLCPGSQIYITTYARLLIDPATPTTLYTACTRGGVAKTVDGAVSWANTSAGLPASNVPIEALAMAPSSPGRLYTQTFGGRVYRTSDGAGSWSLANSGLNVPYVTGFAALGGTVFATTEGVGVWKTTDEGLSWVESNNGLSHPSASDIAAAPTGTLFAGTSGGLYRSTDAGATWGTVAGAPATATIVRVATSNFPPVVYVTTASPPVGTYKSIDDGVTWTAIGSGLPSGGISPQGIAFDPTDSDVVLVGDGGSVYKSTDGGASFSFSGTGLPSANFIPRYDPSGSGLIFASKATGSGAPAVFRSADQGATWTATASAPAGIFSQNLYVASDGSLYLSVDSTNVFRSTDAGDTWSPVATGADRSQNIIPVIVVGANRVFAGTLARGALVTSVAECGNGSIEIDEQCDDGGLASGDGCDANCFVETGFSCTGEPSVCSANCGDSQVRGSEQCDDGNLQAGDCCSPSCLYEPNLSPCTTDNNPCTDDVCNATGICMHPNNTTPCTDGDPCNGQDFCSAGACTVHEPPFLVMDTARFGKGTVLSADVAAVDVGASIRLSRSAVMTDGRRIIADRVTLSRDSSVWDVFANTIIQSSTATIRGVTGLPSLPVTASFCASAPVTCGVTAVNVPFNGTMSLSPGVYGTVTLAQEATLTLQPGAYVFCSIDGGADSDIIVDAPVGSTIDVEGSLSLRQRATLLAASSTPAPVIAIGGPSVRLGQGAILGATLVAPQASVRVGKDAEIRGSACARVLRGGVTSRLECGQ